MEKIEYQTNEYHRDWKTNPVHGDKLSMRSEEDKLQKEDFKALCNLSWNDRTMAFEGNT